MSRPSARSARPSIGSSATRYLLVGAVCAIFELVVFRTLYTLNPVVTVANPVAVVSATALNFALNRSWSFGGSSSARRSAVLYTLLFLFNAAVSTLAISVLVDAGADALVAKVATMACITVWNFVLYRRVVFR